MFKKLAKLSILSLMSLSLLGATVSRVDAVDVEGKVILNALSKKIVSSVDTFYKGRDESVKPRKSIDVSGSYDEADAPTAITLDEDTTESAKYSFSFPAQVTSVVSDLFASDFGKKKKLNTKLKSVSSILGTFAGELANDTDSGSGSASIGSVDSVGSVSNVSSSLRFLTGPVRAVRSNKNPDIVKIVGKLNSVAGISKSKSRLAKGRFVLQFSQ